MKPIIIATIFYALFSFAPLYYGSSDNDNGINVILFGNNLSDRATLDWLIYQVTMGLFLTFIGLFGHNNTPNGFQRNVFTAIILDGTLTTLRAIIFGYHEPTIVPLMVNAIPLSYIIYSYIIANGRFK